LSVKSIFALIFGFAGVYDIATRGAILSVKIDNQTGVALAAGSSVVWALSWIFNKKDTADETVKLFRNLLFGTFYISIYLLVTNDFLIQNFNGILAVVYVGLFETGITFLLWMKASQLTNRSDDIVFVRKRLNI
jgi:drug/metabolite transporter (DMT)-like permease